MTDGNDGATRERILGVLDWAASVYRPGSVPRSELDALAGRLRDPAVHLSPLLGAAEEEARRYTADLVRAAASLRKTMSVLPRDEALASEAVIALETEALALRARLRGAVTYQEVVRALHGSWGDTDLGEAIVALNRELARRVEAIVAAQAEEPVPAPAP